MRPNHAQHEDIVQSLELALYFVAVEWFLYGIYVVLFCSCIKILYNCRVPNKRALSAAVTVIFIFCTVHWVLQLVNAGKLLTVMLPPSQSQHGHGNNHSASREWNLIFIAMGVLYVTSNLIADGIFVYRCYGVWGRRKRIIAVPITLLVATGGLGYASVIACGMEGFAEFLFLNWLFPMAVVFSVLTNVLLMALTAGRIWWMARGARTIEGPDVIKHSRMVIAMILESGALYVTPGLLYLVLLKSETPATMVIFAALAQIVGIAPTIIVVRVGLGNSVNSVESFRDTGTVIDIRPEKLDRYDEDWDFKDEIV